MMIIEASGDARTLGRATGAATREKIAQHLAAFPPVSNWAEWDRRKGAFIKVLRDLLPWCGRRYRAQPKGRIALWTTFSL